MYFVCWIWGNFSCWWRRCAHSVVSVHLLFLFLKGRAYCFMGFSTSICIAPGTIVRLLGNWVWGGILVVLGWSQDSSSVAGAFCTACVMCTWWRVCFRGCAVWFITVSGTSAPWQCRLAASCPAVYKLKEGHEAAVLAAFSLIKAPLEKCARASSTVSKL